MGVDLTLKVKDYARSLGADLVGVAPVERFDKAPRGYRPTDILPNARSVIVIAVHLIRSMAKTAPSRLYTYHYDTVKGTLRSMGYKVALFLEKEGHQVATPPVADMDYFKMKAAFSTKHAAVEAGLGVIGRNQLLLTPKYGPRVLLVAVITDASLTPDPKFDGNLCAYPECKICIEQCPSGALSENGYDILKCWMHGQRIRWRDAPSGVHRFCAHCLSVCPVGDQ